jgi:hypothetical protein
MALLLMLEGKRIQRKLIQLQNDDKPCSLPANFVDQKKWFGAAGFCFAREANAKSVHETVRASHRLPHRAKFW